MKAMKRVLGILTALTLALALALTSGCTAPAARQWLDRQTAATITAQTEPVVLSREDFPAGVNVRDYVELGLFDVNRAGTHRSYVALVLWSTVDRDAQQLSAQDAAFATITLWADDQPLTLRQVGMDVQQSLVSDSVLPLPSPNARTAYYEITKSQLAALAAAGRVSLSPANEAAGERPYTLWRGKLSSIAQFIAALSG